jgi:hypothetical protein
MLLGAEVAMLLFGLYALIAGKVSSRKGAPLTGLRARIIGVVLLAPFPLIFVGGFLLGFVWVLTGHDPKDRSIYWYVTGMEASIVIACAIAAGILQRRFRKQMMTEITKDVEIDESGAVKE